MNKKFFTFFAIILFIVFSFSICLATTNESGLERATNDVRNFVGGVENTVENAASDVSNTSRTMTGRFENTMSGNTDNTFMGMTDNNDGGYTARRTTTDTTTTTFMGMTTTAWTWIILGIAAIGIIAVVWYYSMQFTNNNNHTDME